MIGEMASGTSITVSSARVKRDGWRTIHSDAPTPKSTFKGTATTATSAVRRMEWSIAGSRNAEKNAPNPWRKACWKTKINGTPMSAAM